MAIDFALTPIGDVDVTGSFAGLLKARPDTMLLGPEPGRNARSIRSFLQAIDLESPTETVSNLILTSHATLSGSLSLKLTDSDVADDIDYDDLAARLEQTPALIRASGDLVRRAVPDAGIIIKGCNLGRSSEFMELLQRAIGERTFGVIASLYSHCASRHPNDGGWIEFMKYDFYQDYFLSRKDEFDKLDEKEVKKVTRAKLLADLKANPRNRVFDGSSFSSSAWDKMIPKLPANATAIPKPVRQQFTAKFPPSWNLPPMALKEVEGNGFVPIEKFEVNNIVQRIYPINGATGPDNKSDISERRDFIRTQLANDARHQANHPYPVYKRYGFTNLDDYVNHFDWGDSGGNMWVARTWRFGKSIPITDPATGTLIANHYGQGIRREHEALLETNGFLFAAIPASP